MSVDTVPSCIIRRKCKRERGSGGGLMGTLQETSWKNRCESNRIGLEYRRLRHRPPLIASITWCEAGSYCLSSLNCNHIRLLTRHLLPWRKELYFQLGGLADTYYIS